MLTKQLPETWHFVLVRNDRWPAESFRVVDQDGQSIINYTVRMQIKGTGGAATVLKELTHGSGFAKSAEKTSFDTAVDLPVGKHAHDIEIILPGGHVYTRYTGTVTVFEY